MGSCLGMWVAGVAFLVDCPSSVPVLYLVGFSANTNHGLRARQLSHRGLLPRALISSSSSPEPVAVLLERLHPRHASETVKILAGLRTPTSSAPVA